MNLQEKILRAINYSRLLGNIIADERKALENNEEDDLVKFTDEKIDLSYKITEILNEVVDGRSDFSSSESKNFRDLVQINESNQKNNKINGAIIAGLISSNKILLSAITGSTISEVYGQSGRMPSNNGNKNLAKA